MLSFTDEDLDSYLEGRSVLSRAQLRFLTRGWDAPKADGAPGEGAGVRVGRRSRIAREFSGEWSVISAGRAMRRCNDLFHPFRPASDFTWLVGDDQPGSVLVIDPQGESTLYRDERPPLGHPLAYLDGHRGAFWDGEPEPPSAVSARLGLPVRPLTALPDALRAMSAARTISGLDDTVDGCFPEGDRELAREIARGRLIKDAHEIALLRRAAANTVTAFEGVAAALPAAIHLGEGHLEGVFTQHARSLGYGPAYNPVVGAGGNSTVLHWMRNDGAVLPGDLVLVDAGIEGEERYATDVTRTLPVSGRYSGPQRAVYDIVFAAQEKALEAVQPGVSLRELNAVALSVLVDGLGQLGLLRGSAAEGLSHTDAAVRWVPHGIGHMLGVDVHDSLAVVDEWMDAPLEAGHVITIEPGLYLSPHDRLVPKALRGIGVRIEDDVLVTASGHDNLTAALPRHADEVEEWLAPHLAAGAAR